MLHIILLILKITGITIAVILGIILLLILAILFVPVRYSAEASYDKQPLAHGKATWLFHLIRFHFRYDKTLVFQVKILFFTIYGDKKKKVNKTGSHKTAHKKKKKKSKSHESNYVTDFAAKTEPAKPECASTHESVSNHEDIKQDTLVAQEVIQEHSATKKKKSFILKIKEIIFKIYDKIKSVIHKCLHLKESVVEKLRTISDILNDQNNRKLVAFLWEQLKLLLKKIKPRKYQINLVFGLEDPYETGQIAMYSAVLYGLLGMNINIVPNFNQAIFKGDISVKGRLRLFGILLIGLRVYKNKLFQKIILKSGS
jgi:hypothetical protein